MNADEPKTLVDQKDALEVYVRALLREDLAEPVPEVETPPAPPRIAPAPPVTKPAPAEAKPAPAPPAAIPEWGRRPFQAMLFRVAGLTLAVPLVELSGVQEWDAEQVTPLPGHAPWYLGLMDYRGRSVPVVDTALLVLPPERRTGLTPAAERVDRVVFIGEGNWGLACDAVAEVVTLNEEKVRWRTSRTRRQWLAGTVIDHMCALIDPPAFARMLATGHEDAQSGTENA